MHYVYLVNDTDVFRSRLRLSEGEFEIVAGLKYDEWLSILFEAFSIGDRLEPRIAEAVLTKEAVLSLDSHLDGYPYFSRISSFFRDAVFEKEDIPSLRHECVSLLGLVQSPKAITGLEKVVGICDRAARESKCIYLLGK